MNLCTARFDHVYLSGVYSSRFCSWWTFHARQRLELELHKLYFDKVLVHSWLCLSPWWCSSYIIIIIYSSPSFNNYIFIIIIIPTLQFQRDRQFHQERSAAHYFWVTVSKASALLCYFLRPLTRLGKSSSLNLYDTMKSLEAQCLNLNQDSSGEFPDQFGSILGFQFLILNIQSIKKFPNMYFF